MDSERIIARSRVSSIVSSGDENNFIEANRDILRNIMGSRYQPHFDDFASLIDPAEFDFNESKLLGLGSYGATYRVRWSRARVYSTNGDISYVKDSAVIKLVANSWDESPLQRSQLFCQKLQDLYNYNSINGNLNRAKNTVHFYGYTSVPVWFHGANRRPSLRPPSQGAVHAVRENVWALVFQDADGGYLLTRIGSMAWYLGRGMYEREMWYILSKFSLEIGSTIRGLKWPHGFIHPNNLLARSSSPPPLDSADGLVKGPRFTTPWEAVLAEPSSSSDASSRPHAVYLAPEIKYGNAPHSAETDAYSFASFVVDAIFHAENGLHDKVGTGDRVFYVEILQGLEAILDAAVSSTARSGGSNSGEVEAAEGESGAPAGSSTSAPRIGRIEAMDRFLATLRLIVSGNVNFHGHYPVPEWSPLYDFSFAFPQVWAQLRQAGDWFNRRSVRLYWLFEPPGYGVVWPGSEEDGFSDSGWSCATNLTVY